MHIETVAFEVMWIIKRCHYLRRCFLKGNTDLSDVVLSRAFHKKKLTVGVTLLFPLVSSYPARPDGWRGRWHHGEHQ